MISTIQVDYDQQDIESFTAYYMSVERKTARQELLPILQAHLEPMVAKEKSFLSGHSKSGALIASLSARSGTGDRPGTMSVFAAATATPKQLSSTWGNSTRQKQGYVNSLKKRKGRRKVFYADFVEKGHRIVKVRNGVSRMVGKAKAVPFASQAVAALGDQQAESAAKAVLEHILG